MDDKNKQPEAGAAGLENIKYTVMPEEFRRIPASTVAKNKKTVAALMIVLGIFVFGGAIFAFFYFTRGNNQPQQVNNTPPVETPTPAPAPVATSTPPVVPPSSLTEQSTSTPEAKPAEPPIPIVATVEIPPGQDTDADGLTDKEEAIYQSDATKPDSDGDGYLDGNEVFYLYNPSGIAPAGILESGLVRLYRNATEGYSIYYPQDWSASSSHSGALVNFMPADGSEVFGITVMNADNALSLRNWYFSNFSGGDINALQTYSSRKGLQGLQEKDRLTTYFKKGDKVYIVNYDPKDADAIWYRRTYDMILNSLETD
jgi:hypothetical protein